jgi:hypothetical protein
MYRTTALMATTHLDLHHERLALSALEGMADQIRRNYIRVMWNHDIRFPPLGRVVSASIVSRPDGEFGLETEGEHWESADAVEDLVGDGRWVVREEFDGEGFEVRVDRGLRAPNDRKLAVAIAQLGGADRPVLVGKKALDPDAVLVIAVGVVVGGIATGLLNRIGEDIHDQLKSRLQELVTDREGPLLIDFDITFERDGRKTAHVLLDGPNSADIEDLFSRRFEGLDVAIEKCLAAAPDVGEIVETWIDGAFVLNYAVRSDGVPVLVGRAVPEHLLSTDTEP